MKKLMIAAAVLSVAVGAMAVESANVVGYQQNPVAAGYKMVTPTFVAVDGGEYNIDDFQVIGAGDAQANIQVMNAAGQWTGMYYWFNAFGDIPAGWCDFNGEVSAGITLKPGDAIFFNTNLDGVSLQSAGQVPGVITNSVPSGYTMIGNGSPVAIDVDDLKVIGVGDAQANIQVMNAAGQWTGMYYYFNEFGNLPSGWFDFNGETPAGITLQPGDAVFFNTNIAGAKVVIPAAL